MNKKADPRTSVREPAEKRGQSGERDAYVCSARGDETDAVLITAGVSSRLTDRTTGILTIVDTQDERSNSWIG